MVDLSSFSAAIVHPVAIWLLKHLKPAQGQQSFVLSAVGFNLALHQDRGSRTVGDSGVQKLPLTVSGRLQRSEVHLLVQVRLTVAIEAVKPSHYLIVLI